MSWSKDDAYHFAAGSYEAVPQPSQYQPFFASLTTLAHVSMIEDIQLGTAAVVLPFRNPIALARQCATLHELTGGRLLLGVCPGGVAHEFERLNLSYKDRRKVHDEYLKVLRLLFSEEPISNFDGKYVKFSNVEFFPKPDPKIPIWYGAHPSEKTARRVVKYCDGYIPSYLSTEKFKYVIDLIKEYAPEYDRDPDEFDICHETYICIADTEKEAREISKLSMEHVFPGDKYETAFLIGSPREVTEKLKNYEEVGLTHFELKFIAHSVDQILDMMELFAKEVKPEFD
jgi:alkanesulfonate monooxygenase SsuD/methylene tetrahydromethanopterin reductase-like flavin-dependent oxidoreductase (luciferase family)